MDQSPWGWMVVCQCVSPSVNPVITWSLPRGVRCLRPKAAVAAPTVAQHGHAVVYPKKPKEKRSTMMVCYINLGACKPWNKITKYILAWTIKYFDCVNHPSCTSVIIWVVFSLSLITPKFGSLLWQIVTSHGLKGPSFVFHLSGILGVRSRRPCGWKYSGNTCHVQIITNKALCGWSA